MDNQNEVEQAKVLWAALWTAYENRGEVYSSVWPYDPETNAMTNVSSTEWEMVWAADKTYETALEAIKQFYVTTYGDEGLAVLKEFIYYKITMGSVLERFVKESQVALDSLTGGVRVSDRPLTPATRGAITVSQNENELLFVGDDEALAVLCARVDALLADAPAMERNEREWRWINDPSLLGERLMWVSAYAERWARLMQLGIAQGKSVAEIQEETAYQAALPRILRSDVRRAATTLGLAWNYGSELQAIYR